MNPNFHFIHPVVYALADLTVHALVYFAVSFGVFALFFKTSRFAAKRMETKLPSPRQVKTEIKHSIRTMLIFGAVGGIIYGLQLHIGIFKFYEQMDEHGWVYFFLSPFLFILLHDTYFYWTHRFMHRPKIFKRFHAIHHQSFSPTPFTVYSFHYGEALIDALFLPTAALFLPIHPYAIFALIGASQFVNYVGHLGHEVFPLSFYRSFFSEFITTTTHHHFHHQGGPRYNYGFYFRFWDRLCGTEDPRYAIALEKLRNPLKNLQKREVSAKVYPEGELSLDGSHVGSDHVRKLTG